MEYSYQTKGVCARRIHFQIENGIVHAVRFEGGCDGNLKAVSKLVEGQPADRVAEILSGNTCGPRGTSCADQLSRALSEAISAGKSG